MTGEEKKGHGMGCVVTLGGLQWWNQEMSIRLWVFLRDWGLSEVSVSGEEKLKDICSLAVKCNGDCWNCSSQLLKLTIGQPGIFFLVLEITQILELLAVACSKLYIKGLLVVE